MKNYFIILFGLITLNCYSQNTKELFIPIKISYFPGYHYRIPWEEQMDKSTWIRILTYSLTNPSDSKALYASNKAEYNKRINYLLYNRSQCDSLVREYVYKASTKVEHRKQFGNGAYYEQKKSGDRLYWRCACLPGSEIKDLSHGDAIVVGVPIKYLEPKDFVMKFKKYKLDSLDLAEAPYYNIFPMDINPSFDCSKATTPIEKSICRDAELAGLDRALMEVYKSALKKDGEDVKVRQRAWMQERNKKCIDKSNTEIIKILKEIYISRINELKGINNK